MMEGFQRCACVAEWRAREGRCFICGLPLSDPKAHTEAFEALMALAISEKYSWETDNEAVKRWMEENTPKMAIKKLREKE